MSGIQVAFQSFKNFTRSISINLLVIGAGGGGYSGNYAVALGGNGYGGNGGFGATISNNVNTIKTNTLYTVTVAPANGYNQGQAGAASSITGVFESNIGLTAAGGASGGGTGGAGGGNGSSGTGTNGTIPEYGAGSYGGGGAGGAYNNSYGGSNPGAVGSQPGQGGGGGAGGSTNFGYNGYPGAGGNGAAGVVKIRMNPTAYTSYTATNVTFTSITVDSIVYSLFTWTTSGNITFT